MTKLKSFRLGEDQDLVIDGKRQISMIDGKDAQKQRLRLRLGTHLQEWFLDTLLGVPWMQLLEKGTPEVLIRTEITKALHRDSEVERVLELIIGQLNEKRQLPIDFTVLLKDGSKLTESVEVNL
ncbi:MAG: hypothetical protein GX977_12325 [Firmicutes bacterium]|nr:hypothetical protein [Bacillota bacterium]